MKSAGKSCIQVLCCSLLFPLATHAHLDTSGNIRENGWIERMDQYVGLKLSVNNAIETFHLKVESDDYRIDLYPNTKTLARLHFNYRFVSFSVKFAPAFLPGNGDESSKGRTRNFGMGAGLNFRHWFHHLSFSRTKGYFINNSGDFPAYVQGGPFLQLPDLVVTNFEGITGYSFNPKFSVRSLTTQTERQLKSAGSFIPSLIARYYIVNNKDGNATSTQRSDNIEILLGAGYHYTLVVKNNFYCSLGATPGIGYIFTKLTTRFPQSDDIVSHSNAPVVRFDGRGAIGYNGRSFFAGGIVNVSGMSFEQRGTTAINTNSQASYQVFVGMRINAPRLLREKVVFPEKLKKWKPG